MIAETWPDWMKMRLGWLSLLVMDAACLVNGRLKQGRTAPRGALCLCFFLGALVRIGFHTHRWALRSLLNQHFFE